VAQAVDRGVLGVDEVVFLVQRGAQFRGPADQFAGGVSAMSRKFLRLDDGIEVAAIGDVDHDLAQALHVDRQPLGMQEADGTLVMRTSSTCGPSCRRRSTLPAGVSSAGGPASRGHQPVLDRHGHRADGAVAAHRQAARGLDEQDGDVAIGRVGG
jgi:hypothetical protein